MPEELEQNNNAGGNYNIPPKQPLGRNQKLAAGFLAVFAIAFIGLWMAQFKKSINDPLTYKGDQGANNDNSSDPQEDSSNSEDLKKKDTDNDGLSDWDELNIYKTSPYLEDSDSDGISDGKEVKDGTDPNCPVGRNCSSAGPVDGDKAVTQSDNIDNKNISDTLNSSLNQLSSSTNSGSVPVQNQAQNQNLNVNTSTQQGDLQGVLSGQVDAATLRKMLLDSGMDKNVLDKISDDMLMQSYKDSLNQ